MAGGVGDSAAADAARRPRRIPRQGSAVWSGGLLALDLLRWVMHGALHRVPVLWRLHRAHHSDLDYDCTIGLRIHPAEALVTHAIVVAAVCARGVSHR